MASNRNDLVEASKESFGGYHLSLFWEIFSFHNLWDAAIWKKKGDVKTVTDSAKCLFIWASYGTDNLNDTLAFLFNIRLFFMERWIARSKAKLDRRPCNEPASRKTLQFQKQSLAHVSWRDKSLKKVHKIMLRLKQTQGCLSHHVVEHCLANLATPDLAFLLVAVSLWNKRC